MSLWAWVMSWWTRRQAAWDIRNLRAEIFWLLEDSRKLEQGVLRRLRKLERLSRRQPDKELALQIRIKCAGVRRRIHTDREWKEAKALFRRYDRRDGDGPGPESWMAIKDLISERHARRREILEELNRHYEELDGFLEDVLEDLSECKERLPTIFRLAIMDLEMARSMKVMWDRRRREHRKLVLEMAHVTRRRGEITRSVIDRLRDLGVADVRSSPESDLVIRVKKVLSTNDIRAMDLEAIMRDHDEVAFHAHRRSRDELSRQLSGIAFSS